MEKVNVEPLKVVNDVAAIVEVTMKSAAIPVVAPVAPETLIVQTTGRPTRDGLMFKQDRLLKDVGFPYTTNICVPPVIAELLDTA